MADTVPDRILDHLPSDPRRRHTAASAKKAVQDPHFDRAWRNVPLAEVYLAAMGSKDLSDQHIVELRQMLAQSRHMNSICNWCLRKGQAVRLSRCSRCYLVWYCSISCQTQDWKRTDGYSHKSWCCKPDAVPNPNDPHKPVLLIEDGTQVRKM